MRNQELMVTVPAKLLNELSALALGYSQSFGRWLDPRQIAGQASEILWESGYEYGQDERLF